MLTKAEEKKAQRILGFPPSEHQKKVFDFVLHGEGNAMISAVAGASKTSTSVTAMKMINPKLKCIFIAFNRSIAQELAERIKSNSNCTAKTGHSLGFAMIRKNLGNEIEVDEFKYRTYLKKNISELTTLDKENHLSRSQVSQYLDTISQLIDFGRLNLAQTTREMEKIANRYDIPYGYDECEVALKCMEWGKANAETIDYTDMIWLPVVLDMNPINLKYDWVLVDEAQDMSLLSIALFQKCFKRGTRFLGVGDENQAINSFAGSCPEAFQKMKDFPNTQLLELPITYRCARSIVDLSHQFVKEIEARPDAPEGNIMRNCSIKDIKDGDMVLARAKAPLFTLYTKLIKKGVNCYIKGNDIGKNLITLLQSIKQTKLNANLSEDGVFVRLYDRMFTERNKLMVRRGLDVYDASLSAQIVELYDTINALRTIAHDTNSKYELMERIEDIFDEDSNGVCLSTVHKAKGLEAKNVFILCHSAMPSKRATHEWEKQQERNVIYVAYTRAKENLGFISEKEIPVSGGSDDPLAIINDMRFCEKRVSTILNKPMTEYVENIELSKFNIAKNATSMPEVGDDENKISASSSSNNLPEILVIGGKEYTMDEIAAGFPPDVVPFKPFEHKKETDLLDELEEFGG